MYEKKFAFHLDSEDDEDVVEKDGAKWTVTRGAAPSVSQLEDRLNEVKASYKMKFGQDLDREDDE
jgi:hypothetical protein